MLVAVWKVRSLGILISVAYLSVSCHDGSLFKSKTKDSPKESNSPPIEPPKKPLQQFASTLEYAEYCKSELGLSKEVLAPWNCLEGKEVPITVQGKSLNIENYKDLTTGKIFCDNPAWLIPAESCMNYAFILERDLSADVKAAMICRNRKFTSPLTKDQKRERLEKSNTLKDLIDYYQIDTAGLIWTNMKTGKTCFFDYRGNFGGFIPSPDDSKSPNFEDLPQPKFEKDAEGKTFSKEIWASEYSGWKSPKFVSETDVCVRCHDSGPFVASPWLSQVYSPPRPGKDVPYIIVGGLFANSNVNYGQEGSKNLGNAAKSGATSLELNIPQSISTGKVLAPNGALEDQLCTVCHRIGSQFTCSNLVGYATGQKSPHGLPTGPKGTVWMPPLKSGQSPPDSSQWMEIYGHHLKHLECCCKNPNALNCSQTQLAPKVEESLAPNEVPSHFKIQEIWGKGPEKCP